MAGLYLHIPFCKQACHYCNFHFSTNMNHKSALLAAMHQELRERQVYLQGAPLESIYLGGGTPSLLDEKELGELFEVIDSLFTMHPKVEITLEANPDDLSAAYLQVLKQSSINRLSIGIQSFFEEDLRWMNRAHDSSQAIRCIAEARTFGFENISVDLIYGGPTTSDDHWQQNMDRFFEYKIPHLSSYAMTVEEGTALGNWVAKGKVAPLDPKRAQLQFEMLVKESKKAGYRHYEISNFALLGFEAVHNSNYWKGVPYLGIGPAAHSFNGKSRRWNISHNPKYITALKDQQPYFEEEILSAIDRYNEYMMVGLRCDWGVSMKKIQTDFSAFYADFLLQKEKHLQQGNLIQKEDALMLSEEARFLADGIASDFFITNEN